MSAKHALPNKKKWQNKMAISHRGLSNLQFMILKILSKNRPGLTSKQIAWNLNKPLKTIYNNLKILQKNKLIARLGKSPSIFVIQDTAQLSVRAIANLSVGDTPWQSTSREPKTDKSVCHLRAHKFTFVTEYLGKFDLNNLKNLESNPEFHSISTEAKLENWPIGVTGKFRGNYFLITPRTIMFKPKAIYGEPIKAAFTLLKLACSLYEIIEEAHGEIKINDKVIILTTQEYAYEGDEFANLAAKLKDLIKTDRWKIDHSKNWELEYYHDKYALGDTWLYGTFINDVISGKISTTLQQLVAVQKRRTVISIKKEKRSSAMDIITIQGIIRQFDALIDKCYPTDPSKPIHELDLTKIIKIVKQHETSANPRTNPLGL